MGEIPSLRGTRWVGAVSMFARFCLAPAPPCTACSPVHAYMYVRGSCRTLPRLSSRHSVRIRRALRDPCAFLQDDHACSECAGRWINIVGVVRGQRGRAAWGVRWTRPYCLCRYGILWSRSRCVVPELLGRSADLNREGGFGIGVVVAGSLDTRIMRNTVRNELITASVQEPVGSSLHRRSGHDDEDGCEGRRSRDLHHSVHASGHGTKEQNSIVAD
jgi:hypothetical protein